ncbi:hypothetical protein Belba_3582 [Belliella baltica DSM 15883]|uniref:Uncharacterized protein n=1 Tax=Belliella baltica (strain DSM 15883 / CIP 108006 / LMG 21964 / BA134) TaxID=866536 RepID=I3ZA11_BELBD|nr:hypothetical protein [Belliella baltica]AFL86079.1 hypothetical protein Belba_3582 [Belliella baltica DSM 15883]
MKYLILCFSFFIFLSNNSFAQIKIEVNKSGMMGGTFFINIEENESSLLVHLRIKEELKNTTEYQEQMKPLTGKFLELMEIYPRTSDSIKVMIKKIELLREEFTLYSDYRLNVSSTEHSDYFNVIHEITHRSIESLERKEQNKNRIVLDGHFVSVEVFKEDFQKEILVHSPREKSHPEIYALINSTLNIFRENELIPNEPQLKTLGY